MSFKTYANHSFTLDRHDLNRDDPDWIANCLAQPQSRVLPFHQSRLAVNQDGYARLFSPAEIDKLCNSPSQLYFLGEIVAAENYFLFTTEIQELEENTAQWTTLRHLPVDDPHTDVVIYAQGLLNWLGQSHFCHRCSCALLNHPGGHKQVCSDTQCQTEIFPRINPAIIVLVINQDRCLLANAKRFKGDIPMYSCLAGYMETGEDFEQTIQREVYEEVGVMIETVKYLGNQSWPYPNSLMIGFHATTQDQEFTFHDGEIAEAKWFSQSELVQQVREGTIRLPSPKSIAYILIDEWFAQESKPSLSDRLSDSFGYQSDTTPK